MPRDTTQAHPIRSAAAPPPHLPNAQISMYINSPGGVVTAGLAIYDTMQYIRAPVATLAVRCIAVAMCTPLVFPSSSGSTSSYCRATPCKADAMQLDAMSLHGSGLRSTGQAAIMGPCCCSCHAARQTCVLNVCPVFILRRWAKRPPWPRCCWQPASRATGASCRTGGCSRLHKLPRLHLSVPKATLVRAQDCSTAGWRIAHTAAYGLLSKSKPGAISHLRFSAVPIY